MDREDRIIGCLLGGAVGDALGAPLEFLSLASIREEFGEEGLTRYAPAYGREGSITDDTQMTLFTADGLLRAEAARREGAPFDPVGAVHQAYFRWLLTQREVSDHRLYPWATARERLGWLYRLPALRARRAPGSTCLLGLRSEAMGTIEHPLNASKGCGGLMRIAPAGFFADRPEEAFDLGCHLAALTHGHPTGYLAAGVLSSIVCCLVDGMELPRAVDRALPLLKAHREHAEVLGAMERTLAATLRGASGVESLGAGWVAEEALAIGLYAALISDGDFRSGALLAVNHGGDSDSTGAVAGTLLGALCGRAGIPREWLEGLELRAEIEQVARDCACRYEEGEPWRARYPG